MYKATKLSRMLDVQCICSQIRIYRVLHISKRGVFGIFVLVWFLFCSSFRKCKRSYHRPLQPL